jgi:WD40 repeat protein
MASGSDDKKVIIWDLYSYLIKYTLSHHENWVRCVKRVSPSLMVSGDNNGVIIKVAITIAQELKKMNSIQLMRTI